MLRRTLGITAFLLLIVTIGFWFIPWSSDDAFDKALNYSAFFLAIIGLSATIYQLRETEIAIRESQEKPRLELEVLEAGATAGSYGSEKTYQITLKKIAKGKLGATLGLRITNSGTKAASRLWFTFLFKRKGFDDGPGSIGKIDVLFDPKKQSFTTHVKYFDYDVRPDFQKQERKYAGITFRFSDDLAIYTDHYDRPVVAEVEISMNEKSFESEFEIHYRIQSYEGNEILDLMRKNKEGANQVYPILFQIQN